MPYPLPQIAAVLAELYPKRVPGGRDAIAKLAGTSGRSFARARILQEKAPELLEEVKAGTRNLNQACESVQPPPDILNPQKDKLHRDEACRLIGKIHTLTALTTILRTVQNRITKIKSK